MFSRDKLLKAIAADMEACLKAKDGGNSDDSQRKERFILEYATLTRHLQMATEAGDDQEALERVIDSLETRVGIGYQNWRELATI